MVLNLLQEKLIWTPWCIAVIEPAVMESNLFADLILFGDLPVTWSKIRPLPKKFVNWVILIIAGLFEVAFAFCLGKAKDSAGSTMYWWYFGFVVSLIISMTLLIKATQTLPIGTSYAIWTGIGAVGTAVAGILVFKEPADFWRIFFLSALIGSIIGLKAVSN